MKTSRLLAPTLREVPADAEVVSHQLLLRAGFIRRLSNGIYHYLPLMWRVLRKVETLIREEMDAAGAQELLMPILQPAELWQASGRWDVYGDMLIRVKDRHDRWYGLAPTAEEVITDIATKEIRSYRQLPVNLYQIQTKYRDETRPRFGLLRGREFIMKDAYSFHASQHCLDQEYEVMAKTYARIFERCGLETRMVRSDSGSIGGSVSHEFMVITQVGDNQQESGENDVFFCQSCEYAANAERAESVLPLHSAQSAYKTFEIIETPGIFTIEALASTYQMPPETILKALLYIMNEDRAVLALIRGDLTIEETKLLNVCNGHDIRLATDEEIKRYTGSVKGFVGLYQLPDHPALQVVADASVSDMTHFTMAVNQPDRHAVGANWGQSGLALPSLNNVDIRLVAVGEGCPECQNGKLTMARGIEVGNIFQLGTKYSGAMQATYTTEEGQEMPFVMGCYGIGVTRTAAAAIERFHDASGMIWPMAIAPYQVIVVPVNVQDSAQLSLAESVYETLSQQGIEVVLDDRDERAGVKFKDADLIGYPIRITAGKKAAEGLLEFKLRDQSGTRDIALSEVLPAVQQAITHWKPVLFDTAVKEPVQ
jgi:prolyl-tRNA synthetase